MNILLRLCAGPRVRGRVVLTGVHDPLLEGVAAALVSVGDSKLSDVAPSQNGP